MNNYKHYIHVVFRTVVAFLVLVLATWLYAATYARQYDNKFAYDESLHETYEVVAFGDSLVEGLGSPQLGGFVSILEERLGIDILNAGTRRDTTIDLLKRVDEDVLVYNPDVVILVVGGNDITHGILKETVLANLDRLFALFAEQEISVVYGEPSFSSFILDDYAQAVRNVAAQYDNVVYVEGLLQGFFFDPRKKFDLLHPNSRGYALMADRLEYAVCQALDSCLVE